MATNCDLQLTKLIGPITAYSGYFNGNRLYFFGDEHLSLNHTCPRSCNDINITTRTFINSDSDCYDITRLITRIIDNAKLEDAMVDIYLEFTFLNSDRPYVSHEQTVNMVHRYGYIFKVFSVFYNCFVNKNCLYNDNARFHYIDVRKYYSLVEENLKGRMNSIDQWIMNLAMVWVNYLLIRERYRSTEPAPPPINDVTAIINFIYPTGINYKLMTLSWTSDDYIDDVLELLNPLLPQLSPNIQQELITLITETQPLKIYPDGRVQHRARAQLYALSLENHFKAKMATNIVEYASMIYSDWSDNNIVDAWSGLVDILTNSYDDSETLSRLNLVADLRLGVMKTGSALMDVYTLARMNRTYPQSNDPKKTNRKIIFAGDFHINNYTDFYTMYYGVEFSKYGCPKPENASQDRCLNIDLAAFS